MTLATGFRAVSYWTLACLGAALATTTAQAVETPLGNNFWQHRQGEFVQTGNGAQTTELGYRFTAVVSVLDPAHFTSATMALDDQAPTEIPADPSGGAFVFNAPLFASRAAMDAAFPGGAYRLALDGPLGLRSAGATTPADAYPAAVPHLTGTDFADLQGMEAGHPFTFHTVVGSPLLGTTAHVLQIFVHERLTGVGAFSGGLLFGDGAISITMPGGVLRGGIEYEWSLYDGYTLAGLDVSGLENSAHFSSVYKTVGTFTTAVPEPTRWLMLGAGLLGLALGHRRLSTG